MAAKKEFFEKVLTEPFSNEQFTLFTREMLTGITLVDPDHDKDEYSNFSYYVKSHRHIGTYESDEGDKIAVFSVCLNRDEAVERARSMQRNYVKTLLENSGCSGALVAFYTNGEQQKWRLSFIRLDYEFAAGKVKEKLTPAKRYSYLVGSGEPCNTAKRQLFGIFENDESRPGLNTLEDAFSVEKVTKEFFELYADKYKQLKSYLDGNQEFVEEAALRGFSSEQFAKKLMGQIVFLYFIQKKGWLGVNAIPVTMTEKEYKNAFFSRGSKSREIIGGVYFQQDDGTYRIKYEALKQLSDADQDFLASIVHGSPWGSGPKNFMRKMFEGCLDAGKNYFDDYLEPLFYTGLNENRGENGYYPPLHRRIPFLNGGLFERLDNYEWEHNNFAIPNEIFSNRTERDAHDGDGILDIFDRYNFTMSEDEPMEREVAIDPEMLGKVFENLLDASDRKSKGAFYTPREIVHYMCQETLINYLTSKMNLPEDDIRSVVMYGEIMKDEDTKKTQKYVGQDGKNHYRIDKEKELLIPESIFSFKKNINRLQEMDDLLKKVRIADLAVGSGAFPVGMLNEIVRLREVITEYLSVEMTGFQKKSFISYGRKRYNLKVDTIRNCIFACDIEPSAVDIAKLRLWLSIVIDDELVETTSSGEFDEHTKPRQLPNLDCNIICGNSLVDEFGGEKLITESSVLGNVSNGNQANIFQYSIDPLIEQLIDLQSRLFFEKNHDEKESIKHQIEALYDNIVLEQGIKNDPDCAEAYKQASKQNSKPFILWQIYFPKVFKENGGFDIVIGNPPYVDSEEMTRSMPELRELYAKKFRSAKGNWDLFVLFIDYGIQLLREGGTISFIVPNKLISAPYAKEIRTIMSENYVREIRDYSNVNVFETAAVYPVVFRVTKSEQKEAVNMAVMDEIESIGNGNTISPDKFYADTDWDKYFNASESTLNIVEKIASYSKLGTVASVNGAATVNEAYLVKEFLQDNENYADSKKFINTGGIDKYKSFWGKEYMRYLKGKYMYPVAALSDIKDMSTKRYSECNKEKIIIGGMNKELECYYDNGNYLAGKSTTIVYDNDNLKYITAVLNSTLMSFYYKKLFNSMSLAGGFFRIGAPQIKELPIAIPSDEDIVKVTKLVDAIQDDMELTGENYNDLYEQIDNEIYKAYGLNSEEINLVKADMEKSS